MNAFIFRGLSGERIKNKTTVWLLSCIVCFVMFAFHFVLSDSLALAGNVKETETIFAYGTLLDPNVQKSVIGRTAEVQDDVLSGYRKGVLQLKKNAYFIAIRDDESYIEGGYITVTQSELERIDRYEGIHYQRGRVTLDSGIEAWVYREYE